MESPSCSVAFFSFTPLTRTCLPRPKLAIVKEPSAFQNMGVLFSHAILLKMDVTAGRTAEDRKVFEEVEAFFAVEMSVN